MGLIMPLEIYSRTQHSHINARVEIISGFILSHLITSIVSSSTILLLSVDKAHTLHTDENALPQSPTVVQWSYDMFRNLFFVFR